ncbi:hypothetical protein CEUSTIGMA_g1859.t1 [Chlamydomonas eustigma]|uniref:Uncharacterized protein n=1 Tax=Chlamydomonas eustigma TaxID=1157962 RepID=A0A250WUB0_9CHLO|nr:hypothetical protein CEUSTIGMA_g1859.t1 [Chlamydomonas eustigma]|eukprot:GAX74411.1 hypothetical protein CEUSTIGMA_g1859.t1 [Chlamydomonas eustigma]
MIKACSSASIVLMQLLALSLLLIINVEAQSSPPPPSGPSIPCYSNYINDFALGTSAHTYTAVASAASGQCCAICSTNGQYYAYGTSSISVNGNYVFAVNDTTQCANAAALSTNTRVVVLPDGLQPFEVSSFTCSVCTSSNCNVAPGVATAPTLSVTPTLAGATNCYSTSPAFGLSVFLGSYSNYEAKAEFELYGSCCAKCVLPGTVYYTNPSTLQQYSLSGVIAASIPELTGIFSGTILNQCIQGASITTPPIEGLSVSNLTCTMYNSTYGNGPAPTTILTVTGGGSLSVQPRSTLFVSGAAMLVFFMVVFASSWEH